MSAESGINSKVLAGSTQVAEITGWSLNPTSNNPSWGSSSVPGFKQRVAGVRDATGSFDFKYDFANRQHATLKEGDLVTLHLYLNAADAIDVPAVIDAMTFEADVNDGEPIGGTCTFSQTGAITYPT